LNIIERNKNAKTFLDEAFQSLERARVLKGVKGMKEYQN
jgi:hypothetical protein